jgi:AraC-like DNA-binding protein
MSKPLSPAVDTAILSAHGVTRGGQPLSYNRAPEMDVAPWIGRLYAAKVAAPDDYRLDCGLFNDTAMVRVQLAGHWTAETAIGLRQLGRAALIVGPQTRRMPVSVTGAFISVGYSLRPGASRALKGPRMAEILDRFIYPEEIGFGPDWLLSSLDSNDDPEGWVQILEEGMRRWVRSVDAAHPDELTVRFENQSFVNPARSIADFAEEYGVGERTVERIVLRDFGMSPKQVLRRARALDLASYLRGVADHDEADQLMLRYYDQSHLIREFTELFGMLPSQFVATPQPLLTLGLEARQARRLEALERIAPGAKRPWE